MVVVTLVELDRSCVSILNIYVDCAVEYLPPYKLRISTHLQQRSYTCSLLTYPL